MKQLLCIFFLFFSISCGAQPPSVIYLGDSGNVTVQRGAYGSIYGLIYSFRDTGSIPTTKRYVGLTVCDSTIHSCFTWLGSGWVEFGGGSGTPVNIATDSLTSTATHDWNLANYGQTISNIGSWSMSDRLSNVFWTFDTTFMFLGLRGNGLLLANLTSNSVGFGSTKTTYRGSGNLISNAGQVLNYLGVRYRVDTTSFNITLDSLEHTVMISALGHSDTIFLPPAATYYDATGTKNGIHYTLKRIDTITGHTVIIKPFGSEKIDGSVILPLSVLGASAIMPDHRSLFTDGTQWYTY